MKVKKGKLFLWLIILVVWIGGFTVVDYAVGQHYGVDVATQQFDDDTTAYKELRTQKTAEKTLTLVELGGALFFLFMAGTAFKQPKEKEEA